MIEGRKELVQTLRVTPWRYIFLIFLFIIAFLFADPFPCQAQGAGDEEVQALSEKIAQITKLRKQGRHHEAIQYIEDLIPAIEKALGKAHPSLVKFIHNLAMEYYSSGDYVEAKLLFERELAIVEEAHGTEHPDVAAILNNLAAVHKALGNYSKAELLYQRSLTIREKIYGPDHPDLAQSLNNLGVLYLGSSDYAKAEPLYRRYLETKERTEGPGHPDVATVLGILAYIYRELDDYSQAENLYQRSLAIREKIYGSNHPYVAETLDRLAGLYQEAGDYEKAKQLYQRSLTIREKAYGLENPDVAESLNNLALLYQELGDYPKAASLLTRSLAIMEKVKGPDHTDVAAVLNNLAALYKDTGDYEKAEQLYQRSLAIREKAYGPENPAVADCLNNLALLYQDLGDYREASPLLTRALAIMEKAKGPDHTDVATILNNLAELYTDAGEYEKAEPLYQRSLAIREKVFGPDHPDVATVLNNLAGLYETSGEYQKAEPLYQRSLAIQEEVYGPDHPDVATVLGNLATLYETSGDYEKAKQLYQRSLAIRKKVFGPDHPDVAQSLNNLAFLYSALGNFGKAHTLLKKAQSIDDKLIEQVIGFTSEEQKMKFLLTRKLELSFFMSLVNRELPESGSARKDALDAWLQRKGVILEAQKRFQEALVYSGDPEAAKVFQELTRVRTRLSRLVFSGPGKDWKSYKKQISDLEKQEGNLEARLSQISHSFVLHKKTTRADSESVAKALPRNTVLLEFARIEDFKFEAGGGKKKWFPARYVSFVLRSGEGGRVEMVDLGDAEEIDRKVVLLKQEITDLKRIRGRKPMKSSRALYEMVFEPLESKLGETQEIYISPDGNLNLIPFEVLQRPDGRFLIEDYTFNYLCAGRDVLRFGENQGKENRALLIGDPDFDLGGDERDAVLTRLALQENGESAPARRSPDMRGLHFSRLPGAGEEVRAVFNLLGEDKAELYTRGEALEEVLRSRGSPKIVHLATHGFFLKDLEVSSLEDDFFDRQAVLSHPSHSKRKKRARIENPLLRSGIALAGANNALMSRDPDQSNGIVTAEKVLGLRLQGTDMVVLSACETGTGEVAAGQGVYGLRRAFTQAGAESIVMSMWSVPDRETKEFMIHFYRNMLSGELNRSQALRQAALQQMRIVKKRYGTRDPFFWGAFVFMGEP